MTRGLVSAIAGGLALLSCAAVESDVESARALDTELAADTSWGDLARGDLVRVNVAGHPELSTAAEGERVDPEGFVHLPHLGSLELSGKSVAEARDVVSSAASRFVRDPTVSLTVLSYGARDVYVVGHVDQPGAYPIDRHLTAVQALSLAGKLRAGAARESVYLLRPDAEGFAVHAFDLTRPDSAWLVPVRADDVLFVPRARSGVFADEILPFLQGLGHLASIPVSFRAFD